MPLYFILFLATLATALFLYFVAVAFAAFRRRPPQLISLAWSSRLQAIGLALLWFGIGGCWILFFNIYRIHVDMSTIGDAAFQAFSRGYTRRLPIVVLPYGATCLVWTLALWGAPARISRRALWGIATLCVLSIVSTPWAAGAQDDMQDHGYTVAAYQQLQISHFIRTLAFTFAGLWALIEAWRIPTRMTAQENPDG